MNLERTPGTANAVAGVASLNNGAGAVTTEALSTAAGGTYTLTIGNNMVTPASIVMASVENGTNTQGDPSLQTVTEGNGSIVIKIVNRHATQAFNGTLVVDFVVFN